MAKLKKFKAKPSSADINLMRQKAQELNENRKEANNQKFEEKKAYYINKLAEMTDATLSSIDKETTPQQLADMLKIGDKEWKSLCATGRKTNKISVPINLYMQTMVANLVQRKILTIPEEQKEGEQNFELKEGKIKTGVEVIDKELEKGISVEDNTAILKGDEKNEVNDISQDVVENTEVKDE